MNRIRKIKIYNDDVTFYFDGSDEPFTLVEFLDESETKLRLRKIERAIRHHNLTVENDEE